jgi:DNA-binding transcriptional LysR family regulator
MANEELTQTLDRLHQQLSHGPQLDEANLRSLRALLDEIQIACERAEQAGSTTNTHQIANERSLNQRLQEVIGDFEHRHPQLTTTLSQIADRLADMGI